MTNIYYYDLDGTLSKLNNTFDFIFRYLHRKNIFTYYIRRLATGIINRLIFLPYVERRKLIIILLFYGIKKQDLEDFYEKEYKKSFMNSLTKLGHDLYNNKKSSGILLTGCTEIPAKAIAKVFGINNVISTEFKCKNGRIIGIKNDTFGNLKLNYVKKNNGDKLTYYSDSLRTENELIKIMDNFILVKNE